MRVPIENAQKQVEDETEQTVSGTPTWHEGAWVPAGNGSITVSCYCGGAPTGGGEYYGTDSVDIARHGHTDRIDSVSPSSGSGDGYSYYISFSGTNIVIVAFSTTPREVAVSVTYSWSTKNSSFYIGTTKTIDLGDDKFVTAVSVVSKSPSSATVTPTKTEHGTSVYLHQNSSSTITATIKLEYYYYETVKEAKVKFNGVVYKHIKFNGQVVV